MVDNIVDCYYNPNKDEILLSTVFWLIVILLVNYSISKYFEDL